MNLSPCQKNPRTEHGSAVVVILAMLAIMMICVSVNVVAVRSLERELKLLEKNQVQRLHQNAPGQSSATNLIALPAAPERTGEQPTP